MTKHTVRTPMPGTFYRKPGPDQPVYKNQGEAVRNGEVIGLVEVMKTYFEVKSDRDGARIHFLVDDAEAVDGDQVIAEIEVS